MEPEDPLDVEDNDVEENANIKKPGSKAQGRRRTKTGCLTCRKRRIKCGEERPKCSNCTKSKRHCEGYNKRVVFKDPLSALRGPFVNSSHLNVGSAPGKSTQRCNEVSKASTSIQVPLPNIAPKPDVPGAQAQDSPSEHARKQNVSFENVQFFQDHSATNRGPTAKHHHHQHEGNEGVPVKIDTVDRSYLPDPVHKSFSREPATHYDFDALLNQRIHSVNQPSITQPEIMRWTTSQGTTSYSQGQFHNPTISQQTSSIAPAPTSNWYFPSVPVPPSVNPQLPNTSRETRSNIASFHLPSPPQIPPEITFPKRNLDISNSNISDKSNHASSKNKSHRAFHGVSDDDLGMDGYATGENEHDDTNSYSIDDSMAAVIELQARQSDEGLGLRSYTSFIDRADMLSTYDPSSQSSPITDSMTARIFCHFINVTGPSMSMFERNPANPSLIFQGSQIPTSQQHIWTYTFPTLALKNEALLHAILAISSLHIAKLQKTHITASLKHYAIALRRIAKSVSIPGRREHPAILAATMLLSFYECWSADHQKWSNHLVGVKALVRDINFAAMTAHIKAMKTQLRNEERARYRQEQTRMGATFFEDRRKFPAAMEDIDENIVGVLMGRRLRYDDYGRIVDDDAVETTENRIYSARELETYEIQRDLVWWYFKHDYIQSILGGGKLFMDYDRWSLCPPRAPLGRLDAVYGTFDHLILLVGRLADFASKDLKRKRMAANTNSAGGQPPKMPHFTGMIPGLKEPVPPLGFSPTHSASPQSSDGDEKDAETQRIEAEEEWQEIRNAFNVLEDHFGEDFQPLGEEFSTPIQTPFGTALQYRTYGVAGIWMNYYMGLIVCHRAHPSMPPAAMSAVGLAARNTAYFANEIGRIAAGIKANLSMVTQVNPGVGAALIESSTCLFLAGVQYRSIEQRTWTICRLKDIARLTGWDTAIGIATGCETAWLKAAEYGKGPPWQRMQDERFLRDIWSSARDLNRDIHDELGMVIGQGQTERRHFPVGVLGVQEDFEALDIQDGLGGYIP